VQVSTDFVINVGPSSCSVCSAAVLTDSGENKPDFSAAKIDIGSTAGLDATFTEFGMSFNCALPQSCANANYEVLCEDRVNANFVVPPFTTTITAGAGTSYTVNISSDSLEHQG